MARWLQEAALAAAIVGLSPATASAQFWDIVKWLNDGSGTQLVGGTFEMPLWCSYYTDAEAIAAKTPSNRRFLSCTPFLIDDVRLLIDDAPRQIPTRRRLGIGLRGGAYFNEKDYSTEANLPNVSLVIAGPSLNWSPVPIADIVSSIEVGKFIAEDTDAPWVATVDAGVIFKPLGHLPVRSKKSYLGNALRAGIRYKQFLTELEGAQLGAPGGFAKGREGFWIFQVGLEVWSPF